MRFVAPNALLFERLGLAAALVGLAYGLIYSETVWRWDQAIYDAQLELWSRRPADDIVIVAIDGDSSEALGAWPWPRRRHAELLRRLTEMAPKAVVFDLIFAEAGPRGGADDQLLAEAMRQNGRVVLPVLAEERSQRVPMTETLPVQPLFSAAAALGHIHFELDADGIARSVYLMAGLGSPRWPTLGLAALRLIDPRRWQQLPGERDRDVTPAGAFTWQQDHRVLLPYAGPPGTFPRLSYLRVLRGEVDPERVRNKIVLIGATLSGLGDFLPTPVSAFNQPMPGVEVHATVIDALRRGLSIEPMTFPGRLLLSLCLVLLPPLLLPRLSPRNSLLTTVALLLMTAGLSMLLLRGFRIWFPPVSVLIPLGLSYPIWSWRRLEYMMLFLNRELEVLNREPTPLSDGSTIPVDRAIEFLRAWMPIDGWVLETGDGETLGTAGIRPTIPLGALRDVAWCYENGGLWALLQRSEETLRLGLHWADSSPPASRQMTILEEMLKYLAEQADSQPAGTLEMVRARVQQLQSARAKLRRLRQLISESMAEMADGVLIADICGRITLSNVSAENFLSGRQPRTWVGCSLRDAMEELKISEKLSWPQAMASVLDKGIPIQFFTQANQRDLLVQITDLSTDGTRPSGIIVNLTDISDLKASERRRRELLGFLSHDLRSPLVSVLALSELTRARLDDRKALEDFLERVEGYTRNVLSLADDFLNLSWAESAEAITVSQVDLIMVAHDAVDKVWPQARRKHIEMRMGQSDEEAWVMGNADMLQRSLVNLLTNAVKYSPPETSVELTVVRRGSELACSVEDRGYGISADELPRVFDFFQRAGGARERSEAGVGLGLAFVKAVADRHRGRVFVESSVGKGTRFVLILPALAQVGGERGRDIAMPGLDSVAAE